MGLGKHFLSSELQSRRAICVPTYVYSFIEKAHTLTCVCGFCSLKEVKYRILSLEKGEGTLLDVKHCRGSNDSCVVLVRTRGEIA